MKRDFRNPIWHNEEKDIIACEIVIIDDEGKESTHNARVNKFSAKDDINPDWEFLIDKFGIEDIDNLTKEFDEEQKKLIEKQREVEEEEIKRHKERKNQEDLFSKKLEIFEVPEIKNSKNREMKSKIRKSKSETELMLNAIKLFLEETKDDETKPE